MLFGYFLIRSKHNLVSTPGQNSLLKPLSSAKTVFLIEKLTLGQSSTNFFSPTEAYLSGNPPDKELRKTAPDTFCQKLSLAGVTAGPLTATILESLKSFSKLSRKSALG